MKYCASFENVCVRLGIVRREQWWTTRFVRIFRNFHIFPNFSNFPNFSCFPNFLYFSSFHIFQFNDFFFPKSTRLLTLPFLFAVTARILFKLLSEKNCNFITDSTPLRIFRRFLISIPSTRFSFEGVSSYLLIIKRPRNSNTFKLNSLSIFASY